MRLTAQNKSSIENQRGSATYSMFRAAVFVEGTASSHSAVREASPLRMEVGDRGGAERAGSCMLWE